MNQSNNSIHQDRDYIEHNYEYDEFISKPVNNTNNMNVDQINSIRDIKKMNIKN